jgi:hypothetical protein
VWIVGGVSINGHVFENKTRMSGKASYFVACRIFIDLDAIGRRPDVGKFQVGNAYSRPHQLVLAAGRGIKIQRTGAVPQVGAFPQSHLPPRLEGGLYCRGTIGGVVAFGPPPLRQGPLQGAVAKHHLAAAGPGKHLIEAGLERPVDG